MLTLTGKSAGPPDASVSSLTVMFRSSYLPFVGFIPADGSTVGVVVVQLADSSGNSIPGKTISLSSGGSHVLIN